MRPASSSPGAPRRVRCGHDHAAQAGYNHPRAEPRRNDLARQLPLRRRTDQTVVMCRPLASAGPWESRAAFAHEESRDASAGPEHHRRFGQRTGVMTVPPVRTGTQGQHESVLLSRQPRGLQG
jgi:hypothetical protein